MTQTLISSDLIYIKKLKPWSISHVTVVPVELVESQFDFRAVGLPVAAPVTEDLLDAPDTERLRSIQV